MNTNKEETTEKSVKEEAKPNEQAGFYFSSVVKITDPNTNKVLVHIRGDY